MLVHTGSLLTVTWARLDERGNARQPTEFKFMLMDHGDEAFLELAAAVRAHKAQLSADLDAAPASQVKPAL